MNPDARTLSPIKISDRKENITNKIDTICWFEQFYIPSFEEYNQ